MAGQSDIKGQAPRSNDLTIPQWIFLHLGKKVFTNKILNLKEKKQDLTFVA